MNTRALEHYCLNQHLLLDCVSTISENDCYSSAFSSSSFLLHRTTSSASTSSSTAFLPSSSWVDAFFLARRAFSITVRRFSLILDFARPLARCLLHGRVGAHLSASSIPHLFHGDPDHRLKRVGGSGTKVSCGCFVVDLESNVSLSSWDMSREATHIGRRILHVEEACYKTLLVRGGEDRFGYLVSGGRHGVF